MLINGTHATTPTELPATGTGRHRQPAAPARGTGVERRDQRAPTLGGTDFLTLMLAQLQESGSDQSGRQQHLPDASSPRSAKCRASPQLNTSFSALSSSLTSSQALQASSLARPSGAGRAARRPRWRPPAARSRGAVSVPQTTSQVMLNITNSAGVLVQSDQSRRAIGGSRQFLVERHSTSDGSQAPAGHVHLERAGRRRRPAARRSTTLVNGTVDSVTHGRGHRRD